MFWGVQTEEQSQATAYLKSDGIAAVRKSSTTNFVKYSEDFSKWSTVGGATITSGITDPSGFTTAAAISNLNSINDGAVLYNNEMTISANDYIAQSIYLKGSGTIAISIERAVSGTYFLFNKTITLTSNWQRFENVVKIPSVAGGFHFYVRKISGTTATSVDIAFAQLEQQTQAETYAKTTGLPVTIDLFTQNSYGTMTNMSSSDIVEDTP